jgi:hypothetical protein
MERGTVCLQDAPPLLRPTAARRVVAWLGTAGWPIVSYLCSRLVLLLAGLDVLLTGRPLAGEMSLFDGQWYLKLAHYGYPAAAVPGKSVLGFLPLYPLVIRAVAGVSSFSLLGAALITSFTGGLISAVLVQRVATLWWGEATARRATLVFCVFPGSVVFSMAYSECLTLPLVLGCLLALACRRWLGAGLLAGLASAVEPAALILIPVCVAVAVHQIRTAGWPGRSARRSLLAPLLAPSGLGLFAGYLWYRTGTPFASYDAQRVGWHQGDPVTLLGQPIARQFLDHPETMLGHLLNPSLWNGLLGSAFLLFSLTRLYRVRHELTPGAFLWTCGVGALTLWSVMTLTNARMLLIAFPAVIVWARVLTGRRFALFLGMEVILFLFASGLTFAGLMLPL